MTPARVTAGIRRPPTLCAMSQLTAFDLRFATKIFTPACFAVGIAVSAYPWPVPAGFATAPVDRVTAWRLAQLVIGCAICFFGIVSGHAASIEDSKARRAALRTLAGIALFVGTFYFAPAWPVVSAVFPAWMFAPPIAVGALLLYVSSAPRRRRLVAPDGSVVFHDRPSLTGRFEASIRQAARQEERTRLARDLHDAVKQQLFVIQTAAATVEQRFGSDPAGAQSALSQVRASARDALKEMEVMLEQLQAVPIGNTGLIESLKRQCEVIAFRTGADVRFVPGSLPPDAAFPPGAHQAMLRFAQEALANVARHARARQVTVTLERRDSLVALSIADDGQGFDAGQPPQGMGLSNMAARAAEAEGTYSLKSAPGQGTTVSLLVQPDAPDRARFLAWVLGAAALMVVFAMLLRIGPGAVAYVCVAELVCATVLVDNAVSWWRARQWP
jgi:signal transduction histidine kinase